MTLHLYLARRFLRVFAGLCAVFLALIMLVDLVEQLRRFDVDAIGFSSVLWLTVLNAPKGIYQILPLVMILSTVTLFISLARSSELVVIRAAGRPALASLMAPVAMAAFIGLVAVSMGNPIVAATTKEYHDLSDSYRAGGASVLSLSREGIWLRQGDQDGQTVIHAGRSNADATILYDVTFVSYAPSGGPERRLEAARASLTDGAWILNDVKDWPLDSNLNPEASATQHDSLRLPSTLTIDRIRNSFGQPSVISIWDMPDFIGQLEEAGFSARRHLVWYYMELAQPLFLVAMVLISASFTMRHSRFGKTGLAVLMAVLMGFALYYIRNFAQILGENGQLNIALAAWAPPIASVLLALGLLLHMEDG